jgi:DNA-directed RNA polymerase subunit RPC12/RpoP
MSESPAGFRCSECGAALGGHWWRVCTACGKLFCRRHLIIERDAALCAACRHDRQRLDEAGRRP